MVDGSCLEIVNEREVTEPGRGLDSKGKPKLIAFDKKYLDSFQLRSMVASDEKNKEIFQVSDSTL